MPDFLVGMPLKIYQELHFVHDGAPALFRHIALKYLNRKLPGLVDR
jgi:hypothetical protein